MVIISLLAGIVLGAILVVFVVQNAATVVVTFLAWQITASLSLVLLATILGGIMIALLVLLPSLIVDEMRYRAVKRRVQELEHDLADRGVAAPAPTAPTV